MSKFAREQKNINGNKLYTIVPHIPGGFITPDDIIKIGEVSKKYNASLKINSNQKISIINLKEDDIEKVWEELNMEASVKNKSSVINVEICSANFCKMSKHPVIGIGMKISKNFHGMELPAKIRIGVSGCRHSCIGSYSKDVGIAVDKDSGFFITVGGTSGINPRHPDILVENIDEKETYIILERLLNYYKENGMEKEKLSKFIDRITIEKLKQDIVNN